MSLAAVAAAWLFLPESRHPRESPHHRSRSGLWATLRATQSRLLLLQYFLHTGSISAVTYLFPLWVYALLDWQAREVGIVFGVVGAIMALNQGVFMGRFLSLVGEIPLLRICTSLFLAGLFLTLFASGAIAMVASLILALGGATLCMPILNAMTSRRGGVDDRGRLLGAASAAAGAGRVVGPIVAGALLSAGSFPLAWGLPFAMVAAYWLWAWSHWATREPPLQAAA
jgi:predicted MFS family arabinose efflux permease